jgi:hypothetical protein
MRLNDLKLKSKKRTVSISRKKDPKEPLFQHETKMPGFFWTSVARNEHGVRGHA